MYDFFWLKIPNLYWSSEFDLYYSIYEAIILRKYFFLYDKKKLSAAHRAFKIRGQSIVNCNLVIVNCKIKHKFDLSWLI